MSSTLYALIIAQGASLSFAPGYTSLAECAQQYRGPNVGCFEYNPDGLTWTAFFKLGDGELRRVGKIPSEGECQRYIAAFKPDVPAACRQLASPDTCSVTCRAPEPPPLPPKPEPPLQKPDHYPPPANTEPPRELPIAFRGVTVGPTPLRDIDKPYLEERPPRVRPADFGPKPKVRTAARRLQPPFDPFRAFIAMLTPRGEW
jgi:hypothetical protein